jgi:hypothetical protein
MLISEDVPFSDLFWSGALTAPLNFIYEDEPDGHCLHYAALLYFQLGKDIVPAIEPDLPITFMYVP